MTDPMSPEELRACRERAEACFRAPWIASDPWTVEADGDEDCKEVRSVLSPDEYPGGQVVAECRDDGIIATPGLREFAAAHSAFIAAARTDVPRLLATVDAAQRETASHRHAALLAAGIHGGPHAWRWASDPQGTTLTDEAAWERLLGEMREYAADADWCERNAPNEPAEPEGPAWAMGYTDTTGTVIVEYCGYAFDSKTDAAELLGDSPDGLWYWEGFIRGIEGRDGDCDCEAVGKFTPTNARLVSNAEAPGDDEEDE